MISLKVTGFEWEKGNLEKCQKHGISVEEIETFFKQKRLYIAPDIKHSDEEQRFLAAGNAKNGRPMFAVFTLRDERIRPISARYMHRKEARKYEETFRNENR